MLTFHRFRHRNTVFEGVFAAVLSHLSDYDRNDLRAYSLGNVEHLYQRLAALDDNHRLRSRYRRGADRIDGWFSPWLPTLVQIMQPIASGNETVALGLGLTNAVVLVGIVCVGIPSSVNAPSQACIEGQQIV